MGFGSPWHWLVVLLIVVLIFGTKKLRNIGADLGNAVRGFKDGMKSSQAQADAEKQATDAPSQQIPGTTIEGEVKKERTQQS